MGSGRSEPDLLGDFEAQRKQRGPRCTVMQILGKLDPERRAKLEAALGAEAITGTMIQRVLRSWDFELSSSTIQRHRNRDCACPR